MLDAIGIQRTRDILRDHINNVLRMVEGVESGDGSHTCATVAMTCNAAASALLTAAQDIDVIKAGCSLRLTPRDPKAWPRVPRIVRDADLPAVSSAARA